MLEKQFIFSDYFLYLLLNNGIQCCSPNGWGFVSCFSLVGLSVLVCVRSMVDTEMNKQKQTVSLWNSFLLGMERNEQKQ